MNGIFNLADPVVSGPLGHPLDRGDRALPPAIMSIEHIRRHFQGAYGTNVVIGDVSLVVRKAEFVTFVGPSAAGCRGWMPHGGSYL